METPLKPYAGLLDRYAIRTANEELFAYFEGVLCDVVNQTSWIYGRCMRGLPKGPAAGAPLLLFRYAIEHVDAVHLLVAAGATVPAKVHLRSLLEARFYVGFMLEQDWQKRAAAYIVCSYKAQERFLRRAQTPNANLGWGIRQEVQEPEKIESNLAAISAFLKHGQLEEMVAEYDQFRKANRRVPHWFQLIDSSLKNRFELARRLRNEGRYELFSTSSDVVHAEQLSVQLDSPPGAESAGIRFLRDGLDIAEVSRSSVILVIEIADLLLRQFREGEVKAFRSWFASEIGPRLNVRTTMVYGDAAPRESIG